MRSRLSLLEQVFCSRHGIDSISVCDCLHISSNNIHTWNRNGYNLHVMRKYFKESILISIIILASIIFLVACTTTDREDAQEITSPQVSSTPIPPTKTPFPPSPTPIPVVAVVNGDSITVEEYQSELARYKAAANRELTDEDKEIVINNLVELTMLAQAAYTEGFEIDNATLQAHLEGLDSEGQPLADWLANHGYTEESFRDSLRRSLAVAWMRDKIIANVPERAEQVHVQQMLFYTIGQANNALSQLNEGTNFAQLAASFDPQTNGDLGWFPRGYLTVPELDEVIFTLEPREYSDIIETEIGFHIVWLIEKEQDRLIPPDILIKQQQQAVHEWLERRWKLSTIEITPP